MDTAVWLVAGVLFLSAFTQSVSGFGLALVSMALLPKIIDLQLATPLVALISIVIEGSLIFRYRLSLNIRAIWRMVLASLIGAPIGVILLSKVEERFALAILGIVIGGYALYALMGFKLPKLEHPAWGYLAGFLGGALGGAYNTSGPPVIVYGDCRRWKPEEFKSNLQGFFLVSSAVVLASHVMKGNITPEVLHYFYPALPAMFAGILAGLSMDRWLDPETFRKIALVLLVLMGARLLF
jgi:uncharacterized membrane protein YfcA